MILEILRTGKGSADAYEHTVNVAWSRTDLETLLAGPDTGAVTFFFDPTELERVLDESEVEGHGVREAAVVLSIAAAAAAGASSAAYAEPGGPVGSLVQVVGHNEATLAARGIKPGTVPVAVDTASGFDLPSVDSSTVAGIAGGLAGAGLLIAAAAFAIRRREPGPA